MTAGKVGHLESGRRKDGRLKGEPAAPDTAKAPERERGFVGIDPWAILLEQLMEMPGASAPVERKSGKGK